MNYGLIILVATFVCTNCIYLKRYKRFKETAIHERECIIQCYENEIEAILKQNNSQFLDYKQTSEFISTANKIIASCHSCGDSPLIIDILRSTEDIFNSKEQNYDKVFELNKCAKTTVLEKENIHDLTTFKTFEEELQNQDTDSTKVCQSFKDLEKELSQKMMEICNEKNTAIIKSLLANFRYNITVDKNIQYSSIYECL